MEGMGLAALVVFLFLRNWRGALISALATMPLSLLPTFAVVAYAWASRLYSINLLP